MTRIEIPDTTMNVIRHSMSVIRKRHVDGYSELDSEVLTHTFDDLYSLFELVLNNCEVVPDDKG